MLCRNSLSQKWGLIPPYPIRMIAAAPKGAPWRPQLPVIPGARKFFGREGKFVVIAFGGVMNVWGKIPRVFEYI